MELKEQIRQFFAGTERVEVPTILQMEATECGAASLGMILAYYGRWLPLEVLRQECGVTRDGSNADNILKAARRQGCVAKAFAGRSSALRKKEFPLILFWEFNHFLVLEGFQGDTVYLKADVPHAVSLSAGCRYAKALVIYSEPAEENPGKAPMRRGRTRRSAG